MKRSLPKLLVMRVIHCGSIALLLLGITSIAGARDLDRAPTLIAN